ncbi:hypothetical protein ILUMI_06993 [Ignelater luminosus]|uniref:MD-2-related lipid-recognition domain-containing protein n=1 Tax=Ignelater luminosus TaxID=2038154 RepID=A0A8K0D499_IGNLU|nr:hypothetical protein ILUMI_06993 [Ignelater luminosus]
MEVESEDKYFAHTVIKTFKFNRTHTGINITFDLYRNFGSGVMVDVQGYKFSSNEYRSFPIVFTMNVCEGLKNNDFGLQNLYLCGHPPVCPFKKGHFTICNWAPDYEKFPPYIPEGRYRMNMRMKYRNRMVTSLNFYMEIKSTRFMFYQ